MSEIGASVVIPTRSRSRLLGRCLEGLFAQSISPERFELVVVDDASSDDTAETLSRFSARAPCRFRTIRLSECGGPARARNAGIAAAQGAVLAFTDDDCIPEAGWLEGGMRALAGGCDLVAGRTLPESDWPDPMRPFDYTMSVPGPDPRYSTCNVFYRRGVIDRVGGFRDAFVSSRGDHFGEDTDLAWRAIEGGFLPGYTPDAVVRHAVRSRSFSEYLASRRRLEQLVALVKRYPKVKKAHFSTHFYSPNHVLLYAGAAGAIGALAAPWLLATCAPYFFWRARGKRFLLSHPRRFAAVNRHLIGLFVADFYECSILLAASVRHRHLYL